MLEMVAYPFSVGIGFGVAFLIGHILDRRR